MIEDFAKGDERRLIETDICIIGAGAAGITTARALKDSGLDICLLESGGADYEQSTQDLAIGESIGFPYYELAKSRLRFFGGTTAIWGGRVAQLDAIDFETRAWVPHSGWPFGKEVLRAYYRQAQSLLDLDPVADNRSPCYDEHKASPLDEANLKTAFWQFDEIFERFTLNRCEDLVAAPRVKILLHATAISLQVNAEGTAVESLEIANLSGARGTVKAKVTVLATGGLEVPRLLLASKSPSHPNGLGNNSDCVGRFFMEHPHARGAEIKTENPRQLLQSLPRFLQCNGRRYGLLIRPGERLQEREGILNSGFTLAVRKHAGEKQVTYKTVYNNLRHSLSPTRSGRGLWKLTRRLSVQAQDRLGPYLNLSKLRKPGYGLYTVMRAEQAPNPQSRVVLTDQKDALGVEKIALDWRFSEIDKRSVLVAMTAFDAELRHRGLGTALPSPWLQNGTVDWEVDPLVSNHAIGGYHHMGTARMAAKAEDGVVDAEGRVHGVANLFIAGSAVFPTGGWANPTLTILALSLRLADRLRAVRA